MTKGVTRFVKRGRVKNRYNKIGVKNKVRFFPKGVMGFVKRDRVKNRYNKIGVKNKTRFFPKGVVRFVIGGCFDKRGYEIRQKR